jgi:hypothetical protein
MRKFSSAHSISAVNAAVILRLADVPRRALGNASHFPGNCDRITTIQNFGLLPI